jgi:hypothetical protein
MTVYCDECRFFKCADAGDTYICMKRNIDVSDYDEIECNDFEKHESCDECRYAKIIIYETGTIDDIAYHCRLQGNKLMYDDLNPYRCSNYDFPRCPVGMYEKSRRD